MSQRIKSSLLLWLCLVLMLATFFVSFQHNDSIFRTCVTHSTLSPQTHQHVRLEIMKDGELLIIPADVGISRAHNCMHPLHTHDESGTIHMEYPDNHLFTLGDFFTVFGMALTDTELGSWKTYDGYTLQVAVNGHTIPKHIRSIPLRNNEHITITVTSPTAK